MLTDLRTLVKNNRLFFILYGLFVLGLLTIIFCFAKDDGFRALNAFHAPALDTFFSYFTDLGDGAFAVGLGILLLLFKQRRLSVMVLASYAVSGIIAQVLKHFISEARPAMNIGLTGYTHFINNITLHNYFSFPSGHSATVFGYASILAFNMKNKKKSLLLLLLAVMVGYSRIYTGNHFPIDVLCGSLVGVISGIACWLILFKKTWLY